MKRKLQSSLMAPILLITIFFIFQPLKPLFKKIKSKKLPPKAKLDFHDN